MAAASGCSPRTSSGITGVAGLKGKTVGTVSMASPDKNFISILAVKQGIDPVKDIEWRAYPADLLGVALQKGEIQAFSGPDPIVSIIRDRDHLVEVTNNMTGEFAHRACCVLGIRGSLVRDERPVAAAVTAALMEAQEWVAEHPNEAAAIFAGFTKVATAEQLAPMLRSHAHHHHPVDGDLKQEIALYAQELKQASVFKAEHRSGPVRRSGLRGRSGDVTELARSARVARDPASDAGMGLTRHRIWRCGVLAAVVWLAIAWSTARWPDVGDVGPAGLLAGCMAAIGFGLLAATVIQPLRRSSEACPSRSLAHRAGAAARIVGAGDREARSVAAPLLRDTAVIA